MEKFVTKINEILIDFEQESEGSMEEEDEYMDENFETSTAYTSKSKLSIMEKNEMKDLKWKQGFSMDLLI